MADFTKRFKRGDGPGDNAGDHRTGSVAVGERTDERTGEHTPPPPVRDDRTVAHDRDIDRDRDVDRDRGIDRDRGAAGHATDAHAVRSRQRDAFGGFNWGSAFFGWLVAIGIGALLTAILTAAGTAIGLTSVSEGDAQSNADTIGIGGGILLLIVSMIAYYAGGYVAGRMSRFDGARQGFGVWVFGLIVTVAIAAAGWILGDKYNIFEQLNLPRIPVDTGDLTTGGLIALAAILLGTLFAAITGGKVGQRYHNKVDRAGFGERV